jgi:two-component system response regulator HydG
MRPHDNPRVLVVDDRLEMAETLAEGLDERGFQAVSISSGKEAIRMLQSEHFDAIVTDLRMPEIDGLALLRASYGLDPSRPVILMTAYGSVASALEASGLGAYHYLMKPFRLDALVWLIERALAGP